MTHIFSLTINNAHLALGVWKGLQSLYTTKPLLQFDCYNLLTPESTEGIMLSQVTDFSWD